MKHQRNFTLLVAGVFILVSLVAACGRRELPPQGDAPSDIGSTDSAAPTDTPKAAATPLSASFGQATLVVETAEGDEEEAAEEATPTPGVDLSRGERTYTNKECGDCHGVQGEGVEGKGEALAGTTLSEEEFTDILRTGGNGELGNEHLYGPQAISPSGMETLYQYVLSFSE